MIKSFFFALAALIGLAAICIGIIGQSAPHLLLTVPHVGFILWMMTGHSLPPYFSPDAWSADEFGSWIRDGDVVVAVGAKSGTSWMLYCSHQIRTKGSDDVDYGDISYSTPWPDYIQTPGVTWQEQKPLMETTIVAPETGRTLGSYWNNPSFPFRIFKSHYGPTETGGVIHVKEFPKVKFLAMARNGMDVVASMVPFFNSHTDQFRKIWGGFPPASNGNETQDIEARLTELLPGGMLYDLYFAYIKQWWPLRHEPNVLLLHYSDANKDLRGTVQKLAHFYEVELNDAELDIVTDKCSLAHMKKHSELFMYASPLNAAYEGGYILHSGATTRTGRNGDGKQVLSEEQQARWSRAMEEELPDPAMRKWAMAGGELPSL